MMKKISITWLAIFAITLGLFSVPSSSENLQVTWDLPTEGPTPLGTKIYIYYGYNTNYNIFTNILTVWGTNNICTIPNLPYGKYSIFCRTFITNGISTNILESDPSNLLFFSHSSPTISQ